MGARPEMLSSLTGLGLRWDASDGTLECTSPHALTRAAGYLKHVRGQRGERVFFRGQTRLYDSCLPSLFRDDWKKPTLSRKVKARRVDAFAAYLEAVRRADAFIPPARYAYEHAHEPLLQHYGVKTEWLDVVDNVWTALWFAAKACLVSERSAAYWHFADSEEAYAYIVLLSPGPEVTPVSGKAGLYETETCEVIDLRVAAPSLYVRPHAQHAVLFRRKDRTPGREQIDAHVVGTIKIRATTARGWLGAGFLHEPHVVFPPPHYDAGYARLLAKAPPPPPELGAIAIVFA